MNESKEYIGSPIDNICRVCLIRTRDLHSMCENIENMYRSCVDVVLNEDYMKTCSICKWMLKKLSKFKNQCQMANKLLNQALYMDTKCSILQDKAINLTQTKLHTYSFLAILFDRKNEFSHSYDYEIHNEDYNLTNNINIYDISKNFVDNGLKNEKDNESDSHNHFDSPDNHYDSTINYYDSTNNDYDNDEIPLVLLKNQKKKKRRLKNDMLRKESKSSRNGHEKFAKVKRKKELKEGFTSRMVQETQEYIVIKLTKEQVLKEMEERSKTDAYLRSPFKCEKCVKGFNFDDVLQTHLEKHTMKNGSFQCEMCQQFCPSAVSLRGHIKSHTTRYKCKVCNHIRLSRQHLLEHHAICHTSEATCYNCDYCEFTTNKRTIMQRHVRRHASNESHACHKFGKLFKSIESLRCNHEIIFKRTIMQRHVRRHASNESHACQKCGKLFKSIESLRCNLEIIFKRTIMQRHVRRHAPNESHACDKCGKLFKSIESLRLHTVRHDKSHRFKCVRCDATFMYTSLLRRHEQCVHERREYYCVECDIQFISSESLRLHFKKAKKHRDASSNKYSCTICGSCFPRLSSLSAHLTDAHAAPRAHACLSCTNRYSSKDALRAHVWRAHGRKKCAVCGKFNQKNTSESNACCCPNIQGNEQKNDMPYENKIEE